MGYSLFVAVLVEQNSAYELILRAQSIWKGHSYIAWEDYNHLHITLGFANMNSAPYQIPKKATLMASAIENHLKTQRAFDVMFDQFAWFGSDKTILTLTTGQNKNQHLRDLAKTIHSKLKHCGLLNVSTQWRFNPHITLGAYCLEGDALHHVFSSQPRGGIATRVAIQNVCICASYPNELHSRVLYNIPLLPPS